MFGRIYNTLKPDGINTGGAVKISGMLQAMPRVCLKTGRVNGMDIVLHDFNGEETPNQNITLELAEELFCTMSELNIKSTLPIGIHISEAGLRDNDFVKRLAELKEKYGIPRGAIEIELKGDDLKFRDDYDEGAITFLRNAGFNFSLHNFGEGVSLIDILRRYPIDLLKFRIDMFGHSLPMEKERAMLTHIVRMSQTMDIPVLCEGVESVDQAESAGLTESDMASGSYYGAAAPAAQFFNIYGGTNTGAD